MQVDTPTCNVFPILFFFFLDVSEQNDHFLDNFSLFFSFINHHANCTRTILKGLCWNGDGVLFKTTPYAEMWTGFIYIYGQYGLQKSLRGFTCNLPITFLCTILYIIVGLSLKHASRPHMHITLWVNWVLPFLVRNKRQMPSVYESAIECVWRHRSVFHIWISVTNKTVKKPLLKGR